MSKWSLNAKIYFLLSIFIIASISIATLGISKMESLNNSIAFIIDVPTERLDRAQTAKSLFLIQLVNERNIILEQDEKEMQKHSERLEARNKQIHELVDQTLNDPNSDEGVKTRWKEFHDMYEGWYTIIDRDLKPLALANDFKGAYEISRTKSREVRLNVESLLDKIVDINKKLMKSEDERTTVEYQNARNLVITISILAILSGLALAFFIMRALSRSIDQVIASLTDSSNQVTSAAQQIASSSEELSQAATEQAASLEETSSSIEEMNSMVQKNAENAKRSSDISGQCADSAQKGKTVVNDMIKAIDEISASNTAIQEQVDDSNQKISDIVKVIAEIGNKTKVINDIVFQTKLLSFNASVEAARAGEHGKGFAVVAEEVGNLAQMSGNAAKEISSMLEGSIQKVEGIVNETKQKVGSLIVNGKSKVEYGTKVAQECGSVLDEIVESVQNVNQMSNEIATACQEQAQGVQEITRAMTQLDQVTQTNAATSEEAASAAEELSSQSESLRATVTVLTKNIKGDDGKPVVTAQTTAVTRSKPEKFGNVVPMKQQKSKVASVKTPVKMKMAAGGEGSVPSENDPRFEEV